MRILIVDDSQFMLTQLRNVLEEGRHTVVAATTAGAEAVELFRQHKPDIVISDLQMPDMDGLGVIQAIGALDPDARIIICSANQDKDAVTRAKRTGARDFVSKPFEKKDLWDSVSKVAMGQYGPIRTKRALIVDDSQFILRALRLQLEEVGVVIAGEAVDGLEATQRFRDLKPDVVLMDINLPRINGLEALAAIRKLDGNASVIMCSGSRDPDTVAAAMRAGALDFLTKPIDKDRLDRALRTAFKES